MRLFAILFLFGWIVIFAIPQGLASEPQVVSENRVMGDAHPDSCTRWQQWEHGFCINATDFPAYLDAFHFLQLVTVPFVGIATIFVVTTKTPRISKKKRVAIIIPSVALALSGLLVFGGLGFF